MARTARPARPAAVAAGVAASALVLGACAPVTTEESYAPSDGSLVEFSDVNARGVNLLALTAEEGAEGALLGALANETDEDVEFTLTTTGAAPVVVPVPAQETVYLGTEDGEEIVLDTVPAAPGSNLEATLEVAGVTEGFYLPVLDGTLPEYADYLP